MLNYQPAQRSPWIRFLLDYNPFYLLSALCMLAGLFALNDSLDWSPLPMFNVLMLIITLNIYEILLIGFGIFLFNRGLTRDAITLLVLEAFFLVDAGFLNSEIFTQDLAVGVIVNLLLFVLAFVKVTIIFRAMHLPLRGGAFTLIMLQLGLLFLMPGIFKIASEASNGALPALALYAVWWCVGGVVALYGILLNGVNFTSGPRIERFARHRAVVGSLILLGFISILAHLCTSNWVYGVRWYSSNLAPVLLGLTVAAIAGRPFGMSSLARLRALVSLPLLAVIISAAVPSSLEFQPGGLLVFSPLRLALIGAAFVYLHAMCAYRQPLFGLAFTGCLMIGGMGHSPAEIGQNVARITDMAGELVSLFLPKSAMHWGLTSVIVSFVLLLAGVLLSLMKSKLERHDLKQYLDNRIESARPDNGRAVLQK